VTNKIRDDRFEIDAGTGEAFLTFYMGGDIWLGGRPLHGMTRDDMIEALERASLKIFETWGMKRQTVSPVENEESYRPVPI
jgi:hypothetical protein